MTKKQLDDLHRYPLTGIRFPTEVKEQAQKEAMKHGMSLNEYVVRAVERAVIETAKKEPVL